MLRKNILPRNGEYCLLYCFLEVFGLRKFVGEEELGKANSCVVEGSSNDRVMFWGMRDFDCNLISAFCWLLNIWNVRICTVCTT
jgi:hypothetical protein